MARYDIGPYFVKLGYQAAGHQHVMQFSINVQGAPEVGETITCKTKSGGTVELTAAIVEIAAAFQALLHSGDAFTDYSVFWKATPTGEPHWLGGGSLAVEGGTGLPAVVAGQFEITYRSVGGHHFRFQVMEGVKTPNNVWTPAMIDNDADLSAIDDILIGGGSIILARDGSPLLGAIRGMSKTNDHLRKRYLA